MKFVAISDTHGKHRQLVLPEGDVILHAGDVSSKGQKNEIEDFLEWYSGLNFRHKIFIAGNHDFYFESNQSVNTETLIPGGIIYLNDSGVELEGIKIWGSPVSPWFFDWAFNRKRGADISKHWELIPAETDILITHGPPYGIGDKTVRGQNVGCEDLLEKISGINPKVHLFGHIHEDYGSFTQNNTTFYNASCLNVNYAIANPPIVFEI
ncbi:MAG: metallophosphatase domain-containing protein [Bacteroidia bacterium]|nr:metallophosphatase domain-containing protein [Bacteroidia bacterium]